MKRVLLFVLAFCLIIGSAVRAEGLPAEDAAAYAAVRAFLTADPALTPAQAEDALSFLTIIHSSFADAVENEEKEKILSAFSLLVYIRDQDPGLFQLLADQRVALDGTGEATGTYVLNIRSIRFHRPGCAGIREMNEKNRVDFTGSRGILLATGFQPCQMCNP